jgi:uncharacterized protein YbaP (TraB family)
LWSISGIHLPGTSFLFGTMHVRDNRIFSILPPVFPRILACQGFAAEYHLDEQAASPLVPGRSDFNWQSLLPASKFSRISRLLLRTTGLDIRRLTHLPPYFALGVLSGQFLKSDMPCSLDEHLWNYAREAGKELRGVETLQEQMQVLAGIPLEMQLQMLMDCCRNISRFRQHLLHLAALYEKQDTQQLYKVVKKNARGLRKVLLYQRNAVMAERIAAMAREQTTFSAIGAAHLGGRKGVICLLKEQGFRVQPVFAEPAM